MDLIIVDSDCRYVWTRSQLNTLLDASKDVTLYLEDSELRVNGFDACKAARLAPGAVEKVILLTKMQNGVMRYHRQMIENTINCKYWLIVVLTDESEVYQKRYCADFADAFHGKKHRYEIIFDDEKNLSAACSAKKEEIHDCPYCVIATRTDAQLAEDVKALLQQFHADWKIECHVGYEEDTYRGADCILLVGRKAEDFFVPPTEVNVQRIKIWKECIHGLQEGHKKEKEDLLAGMNQHGWNIGDCGFYESNLKYEMLMARYQKEEIGIEAISFEEDFVMWDEFGLPLTASCYSNMETVEQFLKTHCCITKII